MSYSFGVKAASKAEALAKAEEEFKNVVRGQPVHAHDEDAARKAREQACELVPEAPEGQDFAISCSGSISWRGTYPNSHQVVGVSINVYAAHTSK